MRSFSALSLAALVFTISTAQAAECLDGICVGKVVVDSSNRVGEVSGFKDGKVQFIHNGSYHYATTNSLSQEVDTHHGVLRGRNVVDEGDRVGEAVDVFADGRVRFIHNGSYRVSGATVGAVKNLGPLRAGINIIDEQDRVGEISDVFADGRVRFIHNGSYRVSKTISPSISALDGLRAGIVAVDPSNRVGEISDVFADGRARYIHNGSYNISNKLTPAVAAFGDISRGKLLIDSGNRVGETSDTFRDGRVRYIHNGSYMISDKVWVETPTSSSGELAAGRIAIDKSGRVLELVNTFANDQVRAIYNGSYHITSAGSLSPEVATHDRYAKETVYAIGGYHAGTVNRFFKDGRIQFTSYEGSYSIETSLSERVDAKNGYAAGSLVTDSSGRESKVAHVFENGTLHLEFEVKTKYSEKPMRFDRSAKPYGLAADGIEAEQKAWIKELAATLPRKQQDDEFGYSYYRSNSALAVLTERWPSLKPELAKLLEREPELIGDSKARKIVVQYLGDDGTAPTQPSPTQPAPAKPKKSKRTGE